MSGAEVGHRPAISVWASENPAIRGGGCPETSRDASLVYSHVGVEPDSLNLPHTLQIWEQETNTLGRGASIEGAGAYSSPTALPEPHLPRP